MEKKEIFKILKGLEVMNIGISDIPEGGVPPELIRDIKKFEEGYTTCLNEVKKAILNA